MLDSYTASLGEAFLDCYPLEPGLSKGAVLICPGGGYRMVSPREGKPVAMAFNQAGYHAYVLGYSVEPAPLGNLPLHQLAQAAAFVRRQLADMKLPLSRLAVCGFSAGGHLAASLGALWNDPQRFPDGTILEDHRPNALILSYPVITAGEHAHRGSFERLAGERPDDWPPFSIETVAGAQMPPTFLWHTVEDRSVPVQNSLLLAQALIRHKVPVELHLYPHGPHGLSLATAHVATPGDGRMPDPHVATWFGLAVQWLDQLFDMH